MHFESISFTRIVLSFFLIQDKKDKDRDRKKVNVKVKKSLGYQSPQDYSNVFYDGDPGNDTDDVSVKRRGDITYDNKVRLWLRHVVFYSRGVVVGDSNMKGAEMIVGNFELNWYILH